MYIFSDVKKPEGPAEKIVEEITVSNVTHDHPLEFCHEGV